MKKFDSLEQRVINMYIDLFPSFKPVKNNDITELSQKQFYEFIKMVITTIYENPMLLFIKTSKDDYFTWRHNKNMDNKQNVNTEMRKIGKTLRDLFQSLFDIGINGIVENELFTIEKSLKIPKKFIGILEHCGFIYSKNEKNHVLKHEKYDQIFSCWKWLSSKPNATFPHFYACMFDFDYAYTSELYKKLSGDEKAFSLLEKYFIKNKFSRIDNRDKKVALDYVKNYDKKENDLKPAWAERTHSGISAEYDCMMGNPQVYSLRIPFYKNLLQGFDKAENTVKDFIVNTGKKCDKCRYCVQMDKTGKKELAFISLINKNEYKMCPYFPAFQYCWEHLNEETVVKIMGFLSFADKILSNKLI